MDIEFRSLLESIGITDLDDVTITSADQYDLLQANGAGEWVDVGGSGNTIILTAGVTLDDGSGASPDLQFINQTNDTFTMGITNDATAIVKQVNSDTSGVWYIEPSGAFGASNPRIRLLKSGNHILMKSTAQSSTGDFHLEASDGSAIGSDNGYDMFVEGGAGINNGNGGNLYLRGGLLAGAGSNGNLIIDQDNMKIQLGVTQDVEIYYDNSQLIIDDTTTQLVNFQDNNLTTTGDIKIDSDSNKLLLGDDQDLSKYYSGSVAYEEQSVATGIASWYFRNSASESTDNYVSWRQHLEATGGMSASTFILKSRFSDLSFGAEVSEVTFRTLNGGAAYEDVLVITGDDFDFKDGNITTTGDIRIVSDSSQIELSNVAGGDCQMLFDGTRALHVQAVENSTWRFQNTTAENTLNDIIIQNMLETTGGNSKNAFTIQVGFGVITDGSQESRVAFRTANQGTFEDSLIITNDNFDFQDGNITTTGMVVSDEFKRRAYLMGV